MERQEEIKHVKWTWLLLTPVESLSLQTFDPGIPSSYNEKGFNTSLFERVQLGNTEHIAICVYSAIEEFVDNQINLSGPNHGRRWINQYLIFLDY